MACHDALTRMIERGIKIKNAALVDKLADSDKAVRVGALVDLASSSKTMFQGDEVCMLT